VSAVTFLTGKHTSEAHTVIQSSPSPDLGTSEPERRDDASHILSLIKYKMNRFLYKLYADTSQTIKQFHLYTIITLDSPYVAL
jgi:hypothetical protein